MIAICPNPFRDTELKYTLEAQKILHADGFETVICPVFADDAPESIPSGIETAALRPALSDCELAIVIGGDGTILSVAREMHGFSIPLLGVNLGTKGFMTALEPEELSLISRAARGDYHVSRRMMLDVELVRGGETIYSDSVLNDVVMHGYGDCIKLTAWCEGDKITNFSGDGIILSTPTGSTGYSMSAGGPIVEPDAEAIILSPICAHAMASRSFVLGPGRKITVKAEKLHVRKAYLSVDGNWAVDLENGDVVVVRRSSHYTLMADLGLKSFYDIAYEKLT